MTQIETQAKKGLPPRGMRKELDCPLCDPGARRWSFRWMVTLILGVMIAAPAHAKPNSASGLPVGAQPADIDRLAARIQRTFDVPGMAWPS